MPRSSHWLNARSTLTATTAFMLLVALLPPRAIRWVSWIADPVNFVLIPVQHPLDWVVKRAQGSPGEPKGADAELTGRINELQFALLNEREQNEKLREQISELQKGMSLNPDVPRRVYAAIIGGTADLSSGVLTAKAGSREHVEVGSVAVHAGVNLVGRVTKISTRYSYIQPITHARSKNAPFICGVVMLSDSEKGPLCELRPAGDGRLAGTLLDRVGSQSFANVEIKNGMILRLADSTWPGSSQMLVLGEVKEVWTEPTGHRKISIEPRVRLDRVSEVWLSVTGDSEASDGTGGAP